MQRASCVSLKTQEILKWMQLPLCFNRKTDGGIKTQMWLNFFFFSKSVNISLSNVYIVKFLWDL